MTTNLKQGILSNSSLMASRSTTNLKHGIPSNNWIVVIHNGKLQDNKIDTRNIEKQLNRSDR
jgi:hypothetical protein